MKRIVNKINNTWGVNYDALELAILIAGAAAAVIMGWVAVVGILALGGFTI